MEIDEFLDRFVRPSRQHRSFYHFTDTRNLPLVRQHGLLSLRELRARGIETPAPGGNQWSWDADERGGLDQYVHLCFMDEHPMEYMARQEQRIQKTHFLRIAPEVLKLAGVLVTDDVSNKRGVASHPPPALLSSLDLEVIYKRTDWKDPAIQERRQKAKKYEILIPRHVPTNLIINLGNG